MLASPNSQSRLEFHLVDKAKQNESTMDLTGIFDTCQLIVMQIQPPKSRQLADFTWYLA